MKTKLPNFICVGAQKAGTTTLHDILKQHPDICMSSVKETKFFQRDEDYNKGVDFYKNEYFSNVNNEKCIGEVDPEYLYFDYCAERIYKSLGKDTKIIVMLRNPIERAYSHYLMSARRGYESLPFEKAIECEANRIKDISNDTKYFTQKNHFSYIDRGLYSKQVKQYLKYFPKENMFFVLFEEDFIKNKEQTIGKVLEFLDVKADVKLNLNLKSNPATVPKLTILTKLLNKESFLKKVVKLFLPSTMIRNKIKKSLDTLNQKEIEKKKLTMDVRRSIFNQYFKEDTEELESLIGIDCSSWKL